MPYYVNSPRSPRAILTAPGSTTFLLGSSAAVGGTFLITAVALTANVATITVQSWAGNLPVVGTPVTVFGTSANGGVFNVTNVPLSAVNLDTNGNGTVSYAVTGANLSQTADGGRLEFFPQISGETVANGSTIATSPAFNQGRSSNNYFFEVLADSVSALPTAATITPQHAMVNQDAAFTPVTGAPTGTISAGAISSAGGSFTTDAPFVRYAISGVSGTGKAAIANTI